jgi:hypothetical protein
VFVILTLWAVMGLDDTHWLTDVVVGVPLAVAIQAAVVPSPAMAGMRRWTTVALGAALTAIWLAALRAGQPLLSLPSALAWIAVVLTVCWPLGRQYSWRGQVHEPTDREDQSVDSTWPRTAPAGSTRATR